MHYKSFLLTATACFLITSCSPLKPDHPQQFNSFKERRPPRDNQIVASGLLSPENKESKKTHFIPYSGSEPKEEGGETISPKVSNTLSDVKSQIGNTVDSAKQENNSDSESFFQRLLKKFSLSTNKDKSTRVAVNKVAVDNNSNMDMVSSSSFVGGFGQGSSSGASYYDMAEDISRAAPVQLDIKQVALASTLYAINSAYDTNPAQPFNHPAQPAPTVNNPSLPLVDVPQMPKQEDLKQHAQSQQQQKPELSNIPPKPKEFEQPMNSAEKPVEKPTERLGGHSTTEQVKNNIEAPSIQSPKVPVVEEISTTREIKKMEKIVNPAGVGQVEQTKKTEVSETEARKTEAKNNKKVPDKRAQAPGHKTNSDHHKKKESNYEEYTVTAYNYPDSNSEYKGAIIKDKAAKLEYQDGHHIVTGELTPNCDPV